jgi:imidazolonepropionase-like amidohydrolase
VVDPPGAGPHDDAVLAATRWAAEAIGMEREVGSLQPGKYADKISVDGDPLTDAASLQRVGLILQRGRRRDTLSIE